MSATDRFIAKTSSWLEFFEGASRLPTSAPGSAPDKGKVFERLTQLYLKTHPEYQTKLKHVWLAKDELPPAIRSRCGLPKTDEGADLIAETFGGELWAVQCKFRTDTRKPLTVTELATFANLSFNACKGISLAVVVHTCAKPVRKAKLLGKTTEIGLDRWLELDEEEWRRIRAATSKVPPAPKERKPRPHQERAVAAAKGHFLEGRATRGRLIMPCGTGKSLTAFWIAEALEARSVLVAVPSLHLIKQSLADWTREFLARGEIPEWLCVCSDESMGRLERDEFVGGIYELGVDATTDEREIGNFLARKTGKRKIVFATYQSGKPLALAARAKRFRFDLAIMDEAHRTVGSPDRSFGHLLSDQNIAIARRLFMTATERVVREKDETVLSMDDPRIYGECFHQLTFKEAIDARPPIISDYKILTITVSDDQVKRLIEENRYLRAAGTDLGEREAQALAAGIALQRAFREEGVRHAISFHRSIRAAEEFKDQQESIKPVVRAKDRPSCFHISSRKTAGERAELLREFRMSQSALVTNARCLQEGVDIPAVDCVLFADPKQSVVDIVQAAGRAMRPAEGKRYGYILVPIVVPSAMDFAEFAETTEFRQVARVVTALSTQDDRIAEEFRGVAAKGRPRGERIVEIKVDVPLAHHIDLEAFREQVRLKLWERVGRANWRPFEEARELIRRLGLKSEAEWRALQKSGRLPPDIPASPGQTYKSKGWISMGDWLGTGIIATSRRIFRPFMEARNFARDLGLRTIEEWSALCRSGRLPTDIPTHPARTYADKGWVGIGDWLGTGRVANRLKEFRSFPQARDFARSLKLKSGTDWRIFTKSGRLPADIPANPNQTYRNKGWAGMGDWLGTGTIASQLKSYRSFEDAREFTRDLKLRNVQQWWDFTKGGHLPSDIPACPNRTYKDNGWINWGDWLGTGAISSRLRKYRPFKKAREYARDLSLKNVEEWYNFCKSGLLPPDIPASPEYVYKNKGWAGIGDWLETGRISNQRKQFRPFPQARNFARVLALRNQKEWRAFTQSGGLPSDIPTDPQHAYKDKGWTCWGDWLGTGKIANRLKEYRPFLEARKFARGLDLKSRDDWRVFTKSGDLPADIPACPDQTYRDKGWAGIGDWLGTGTIAPRLREYRSFNEARDYVRGLGLKSSTEWRDFLKSRRLPSNIPSKPERVYRDDGWVGYGDWLGTGTIAPFLRKYRHFKEARTFVRSLGVKGRGGWKAFIKSGNLPSDIPATPSQVYKDKGWAGLADWLGTQKGSKRRRK